MLDNDIKNAKKELTPFAWYQIQDDVRKCVLIELVFSMGLPRLLGFKNMIAALVKLDYVKAGIELVDSKWATLDVSPDRVSDVRYRLETGKYK